MLIFGYGSLIFPAGINGRGMKRTYAYDDLTVARLSGYRRDWNAVYNNVRFLGLEPSSAPGSYVNGVIFDVDEADLPAFKDSEGISKLDGTPYDPPMYDLTDVTDKMVLPIVVQGQERGELPFAGNRVYTCVTHRPCFDGGIKPYYMQIIIEGLRARGPDFTTEFMRRTTWT